MSPHRIEPSPWPTQTPQPSTSTSVSTRKRRRIGDRPVKVARQDQIVADPQEVAQAKINCEFFSGNDVLSCFPDSQTVIPQHQWANFVWNSRVPYFTQTNLVDVFLFHGDTQEQIFHWPNYTNPTDRAGYVSVQVNDSWWGDRGVNWNGQNVSFTYFWVITRSDVGLDGSQIPQSTFTAVQTTYADSVASSMSIASASAASASSASARASTSRPQSSSGSGSIQSGAGAGAFPHWAIAVIVVLGFLAIVAFGILTFLIMRRMRDRRRNVSRRESGSSESPMIVNDPPNQAPYTPLLGDGATAMAMAGAARPASLRARPASVVQHDDGASIISRAQSAGESAPFSGADAAIMADAFRKALRKPDFADRPFEEGESPDHPEDQPPPRTDLINRELAEEGRDIRSVSSSRGVRVETLSDAGDTIQDSPH
ncbi:hypothetical protein JAAARDRAFT_121803 [Jaapia argillacea MUCL 33604]|uniref:Transmembrane protein n=1 Tax=Jaapia argillacea MUCL 33604 TaxID=933084 RepID=A0A067QHT3_9AGAM|nr:hypothetical protein JAAARDRAFT_121803 [Jaapia argillacea MUCL 33604]